jgi:hypothetical protein
MQITVSDELTSIIPLTSAPSQLIVRNTGSDTVYFGWEPCTVAEAGESQGVPLAPDETITFGGPDLNLNGPLFFICATSGSTTINYTQRR